jgi:hypothetical protein
MATLRALAEIGLDADRPPSGELRLALRDASWFNYPSVDRVPQYHVVAEGYVAACNQRSLLVEQSEVGVEDTERAHRCGRPACRKLWDVQ